MVDARAIVDQFMAGFLVVPALDRKHTEFEFQPSGHAIHRLIGGRLVAVGVGVQIDKARRGHQPTRVDGLLALQRLD